MGKANPRVDIAFKKIFGTEENKDLLISLINSIVGEEDQVVEVTLMNPYNQKNFNEDKLSILDIKAKGNTGKWFNIEIQITDESDYDKRALYYWAKLYTEQLQEAGDYCVLQKVIGIHILNFISILEVKKYHNVFHLTEKETGVLYFRDLELHTIELKKFMEKFSEESGEVASKIQNSLDMWSAFLTKDDLIDNANLIESLDNPHLKKAIKVLNVLNFTPEERETYDDQLKWLRIKSNTLKKAEEKGRKEGWEQGRHERSIEIAKNMLNAGLSNEQISKVTSLTEQEIKSLQ